MPLMIYKCPACGGALRHDPNTGKFACDYCSTVYEEKQLAAQDDHVYENLKEADKPEEYGKAEEGAQKVYSCPTCGAEVVTDKNTAATMCYYCHNPVVLTGRLAADQRPDVLIPFKYDKKGARERFFDWIKKKRYVPKAFISEESVEKIAGVYDPYWLADYKTRAHFSGEGRIVKHSSTATHDITTTDYYNVVREGDISFRNIERGALKNADRKLSDGVHPYKVGELIGFAPTYLSGYMAQKRDVELEEVRPSVEEEVKGYVQPLLTSGTPYTSVSGTSTVEFQNHDFRYAMLPTWVLTYRGKNSKMYYYAMNGQTGEVCGVLPVDTKKLAFHSGLLAALVAAAAALIFYFFV